MKKVVIFSNENDVSTDLVMDWLTHLGCQPIRMHHEHLWSHAQVPFSLTQYAGAPQHINWGNHSINPEEIHKVYIRKGSSRNQKLPDGDVYADTGSEVSALLDYLHSRLKRKISIGRAENEHAKLYQTEMAKSAGLDVPETLVTNTRESLLLFLDRHKQVATKAIQYIRPAREGKSVRIFYTSLVSKKHLNALPDTFAPSLFQEYIPKEYEIRTFYLDGRSYSMAIFSQSDQRTKIDFRDYNNSAPNRTVPCKLPVAVEKKIRMLMKLLQLNTGSIDLVKSTTGKYYFLEVNQSGQFGMISGPCNYYLEEKIAKHLAQ